MRIDFNWNLSVETLELLAQCGVDIIIDGDAHTIITTKEE